MAIDRMLRADVIATVREAMNEVLEGADEVWLTQEQVCEQFGMLSKEWLYRYGCLLDRERAEVVVTDGNGTKVKASRWAYPKHKIQRMIREGKLRELVMNAREITRR